MAHNRSSCGKESEDPKKIALGNVPMILNEQQRTDMYPAATMDTAAATIEESYYSNLPATKVSVPFQYPANTPPGNAKVAKFAEVPTQSHRSILERKTAHGKHR